MRWLINGEEAIANDTQCAIHGIRSAGVRTGGV